MRRFYGHLTVYVLAMIRPFIVDDQDHANWWLDWLLIGWVIALIYHGFKALGAVWEERKIKRLMEEEESRADEESEVEIG